MASKDITTTLSEIYSAVVAEPTILRLWTTTEALNSVDPVSRLRKTSKGLQLILAEVLVKCVSHILGIKYDICAAGADDDCYERLCHYVTIKGIQTLQTSIHALESHLMREVKIQWGSICKDFKQLFNIGIIVMPKEERDILFRAFQGSFLALRLRASSKNRTSSDQSVPSSTQGPYTESLLQIPNSWRERFETIPNALKENYF